LCKTIRIGQDKEEYFKRFKNHDFDAFGSHAIAIEKLPELLKNKLIRVPLIVM
jgi:hypothetical protein